ncbi:hypothetical protein HYV81_01415 [Candidatus Woesearchaeota archaeon]|nr:hypothetical protein [Candidatus Woesearchaeota archaeon]
MDETDILKKLILQRLARANVWGGKHISLLTLLLKEFQSIIEILIKERKQLKKY